MRLTILALFFSLVLGGCAAVPATPPAPPVQPPPGSELPPEEPGAALAPPQLIQSVDVGAPIRSLSLSPSGKVLAIISADGAIHTLSLHDVTSGQRIYEQQASGVLVMDWSPGGLLAVSGGSEIVLLDESGDRLGVVAAQGAATWVGPEALNVEPMVGDAMLYLLSTDGEVLWNPGPDLGILVAYASNGTEIAASFYQPESGATFILRSLAGGEIWRTEMAAPAAWLAPGPDRSVYAYVNGAIVKLSPDGSQAWSHKITSPWTVRKNEVLALRGDTVWVYQSQPQRHLLQITAGSEVGRLSLPVQSELVGVSPDGRWVLAGVPKGRGVQLTSCSVLDAAGTSVWEQPIDEGGCTFAPGSGRLLTWSGTVAAVYGLE